MLNFIAGMVLLIPLGPSELIIIFLLIFVFFGARKLPDLARGLGEGIREFKKASREITSSESRSESDKKDNKNQSTE